jgi:hypothetical protein
VGWVRKGGGKLRPYEPASGLAGYMPVNVGSRSSGGKVQDVLLGLHEDV